MVQKIAFFVVAFLVLVAAGFGAWEVWISPPSTPVYLSIGDGTQYGCCGDPSKSSPELFRRYLTGEMNREVAWVTTASGYQTTDAFIEGYPGTGVESQFDRAVQLIERYRREHRRVAAITLSIGGNDLVEMGRQCPTSTTCLEAYNAALGQLEENLDRIYARIANAKDPKTPLLVLLYYNASDCGQPGVESSPTELGVLGWNGAIRNVATRYGATLVDLHTPFKAGACKYIIGLDANDDGHAIIAAAYEGAYELATKSD